MVGSKGVKRQVGYASVKDVPVLLVVFKRPILTRQLINRMRELGVRNLFISSDAATGSENSGLVAEVRALLQTEINWDCSVSLNLREENVGLQASMVSSIDWFFSHVEEGIILEDDCLPGEDFFQMCAELLPRFREEPRVFQISGDNTADVSIEQEWSYCFIRYPHIWGWATWKSSWARYDRDLALWAEFKASGMVKSLFPVPLERKIWEPIYDRILKEGIPDTWDFQWCATLVMHDGLSVQPLVNLVSNTGFGAGATHTRKIGPRSNRLTSSLGEIKHPEIIYRHMEAERQVFMNTHLALAIPTKRTLLIKRIRNRWRWILRVSRHHSSRLFRRMGPIR
jgi:hypothetical protein